MHPTKLCVHVGGKTGIATEVITQKVALLYEMNWRKRDAPAHQGMQAIPRQRKSVRLESQREIASLVPEDRQVDIQQIGSTSY